MKTLYKFLFLFILIPKFTFAIEEKHPYNKEKNISKTFDTTADAQLEVTNSYGNVNVYLWDENKIAIQVSIKVSGNNEKKITERLNDIEIDFQSSSSRVSATTNLNGKKWTGNSNLSYEINYVVKIPKNASIDLNNKYGNIFIDKLNGSSVIKCHYGSLDLGQFTNKSNSFDIAYSQNSSINSIDKLNLNCQYSDIEFQKVNQINIDGNYNDFKFNTIGTIDLSSNYSKIKANSIQKITVNGNYLTLKLGEIGNSLKANSNYTDIQLAASNKTDAIAITGNYTNTKITCSSDYAFDIDVNLRYGSFKDNLGVKYIEKSEKNTSISLNGYHLSQGKSKINVSTSYGSVQLLTK